MNKITKQKLIDIIKNKATDCFIFNDYLIVDIKEKRMIIKDIDNKSYYENIFTNKIDKENNKIKEIQQQRVYTKYKKEEELLIKLNYFNVPYLSKKLNRSEETINKKIYRMMKKGEIPKNIITEKLNNLFDNVNNSKTSLENKSKILLEIGRNIKSEVNCGDTRQIL